MKSLEPKTHSLTVAGTFPYSAETVREVLSFTNALNLLNMDAEITGDGVSVGSERKATIGDTVAVEAIVATSDFGYSYVVVSDKSKNMDKLIPHEFSDYLATVSVLKVDDKSCAVTYSASMKTAAFDKLKPIIGGMLQGALDAVPAAVAKKEQKEL